MASNGTPFAHPLTNVLLRLGLGFFLLLWGLDKLVATEGARGIFSHFYLVDLGATPVQIFGVLEILLGAAIMAGLYRRISYGIGLLAHAISTVASWKQLIDPWGLFFDKGNSHLFLASIPVLLAFIVLYMNWEDSYLTLDAKLGAKAEDVPPRDTGSPSEPGGGSDVGPSQGGGIS